MGNDLHNKVFDFLEKYRQIHPELIYWLRERNTKNLLEEGMWFQGNQNYAFVGLYNRGGGTNMTRSFGLVFYIKDGKVCVKLENVFNTETDKEILSFYSKVRSLIGGFTEINKTKYEKVLSEEDGLLAATEFLSYTKPKIDLLASENNLSKLVISKPSFDEKLKKVKIYQEQMKQENPIKYILVNISWNSNDWKEPSKDKSGHAWVNKGNTPHESWNFDFENPRNTPESIRGFAQFTNPPKVDGKNNLVIFYSQNQIVGFYGMAEVLSPVVNVNKNESYNLVGYRPLCILLKNKIQAVKEKGYLENKQRVGQIGFCYLEDHDTISSIINEAILLNPEDSVQLKDLLNWLRIDKLPEIQYWVFQANPKKVYRIIDALKEGILKSWMVNQFKQEIKIGDKVILWVSGEYAGIYAIATVTSNVYKDSSDENESIFYIDKSKIAETDKVNLRMDYNLVNSPILKEQVLNNQQLKDLKQGSQGTNFPATKLQYDIILSLINTGNMKSIDQPLNQILFGPPGTGKTYNTINKAVSIANPKFDLAQPRSEIKKEYDRLVQEGQIVFTTFHQSMSYEDFIEGIKPQKMEDGDSFLKYEVEPGIFKNLCNVAKSIRLTNNKIDWDSPKYYKMSLGGRERPDLHEWCIENNVIALGWGGSDNLSKFSKINNWEEYRNKFTAEYPDLVSKSRFNIQATYAFLNLKENDIVVISKGNHVIDAIGIVRGPYYWDDKNPVDFYHYRKVEWIAKNLKTTPDRFFKKQISQMTIYEFLTADIKKEAFKEITGQLPSSTGKQFVLIIDEINRGNVSQIFGELITLVEEDKRLGREEALEATLPYSKEKFGVPPNLYIIGTMNTADRSVEALDAALRRRFSFEEMPPKSSLIATEGKLKATKGVLSGIDLPLVLDTINKRIEKLLDKDHQIGHSYFMSVSNFEEWKAVFQNKIIPLLQEYFFGDFGKIGLVLGMGFFKPAEKSTENIFAAFDEYDSSEFSERMFYKIKDISNMSEEDFNSAIKTLLK